MNGLYSLLQLRSTLEGFLREDIGAGDITSQALLPPDLNSEAFIICKAERRQKPVLSGLLEARLIFEICGCKCTTRFSDGAELSTGDRVLEIFGPASAILKAERTALNLVMRMSGIATETRRLKSRLGRNSKVEILATRKTAPGLRYFDKKAVLAGGGGTHRMRLDDMVLIKDNHLQAVGSVSESIQRARSAVGRSIKVECEARTQEEALSAVESGADIVMLDNFTPSQCRATIRAITKLGLRNKVQIELSGGINAGNARLFAASKPDYISAGYLTHSAPAVDFSLEIP